MRRAVLVATMILAVVAAPATAQRFKLSKSLEELERVAQSDSNDAAAHYNVALAYWNARRYDDVERSLKTALQIEPRFAVARLGLAYLPFARRPQLWREIYDDEVPDDWRAPMEEANRQYRHAFLIDPMVDLRIIGAVTRGKADFVGVQHAYGEVWALYFQGFADCQEGKYEDCHGRFNALVREIDGDRFPQRIPNSVLWYRGIAATHITRHDLAVADFRMLLDRYLDEEKKLKEKDLDWIPLGTNEYRYALATAMYAAGRASEATVLLKEVLEQDIGAYMAHVQLANIYESVKQYPSAVEERQRAVSANPDDPSLLLDLGVTLGKAGRFDEARKALEQAIELNPRDSRALFWLGIACMQLGQRPEARGAFERFVASAPSRYERQIATARQRITELQ